MRRNLDRANRRRQYLMVKRGRVGLKNRAQKRLPQAVDARTTDAIVTG
jgi:hypothetical protein